jgi:hypothetical protein
MSRCFSRFLATLMGLVSFSLLTPEAPADIPAGQPALGVV